MIVCAIFMLAVVSEHFKDESFCHAFLITPLDNGNWLRRCDSKPHTTVRLHRVYPITVSYAVYSANI
jgi:hypothetical protein